MASKKLTETIEMRLVAEEDEMLSILNTRLEYLDKELEIRLGLSFKKVEPDFEYENDDVYTEHLKEGFKLSIQEEKLSTQRTINGVYNERDQRAELAEMRNK